MPNNKSIQWHPYRYTKESEYMVVKRIIAIYLLNQTARVSFISTFQIRLIQKFQVRSRCLNYRLYTTLTVHGTQLCIMNYYCFIYNRHTQKTTSVYASKENHIWKYKVEQDYSF